MNARRLRRLLSVLSPVLCLFGCEMFAQWYDQGYSCGYSTVDSMYGCAAGCEEQRQERREEVEVWTDACGIPVADQFADQASLDAADAHCQDENNFNSGLVVCEDVGQELNTQSSTCAPFHRSLLGAPRDENYDCPDGMPGEGRLCLCCDDVSRPSCDLRGGFCRDDSGCCSGVCVLEFQDAGFIDDAGTIPGPRSGTCD